MTLCKRFCGIDVETLVKVSPTRLVLYRPPHGAEIFGLPTLAQYAVCDLSPWKVVRVGSTPFRLDGGDTPRRTLDQTFGDKAPRCCPFPWGGLWLVRVYFPQGASQYIPANFLMDVKTGESIGELVRQLKEAAARPGGSRHPDL